MKSKRRCFVGQLKIGKVEILGSLRDTSQGVGYSPHRASLRCLEEAVTGQEVHKNDKRENGRKTITEKEYTKYKTFKNQSRDWQRNCSLTGSLEHRVLQAMPVTASVCPCYRHLRWDTDYHQNQDGEPRARAVAHWFKAPVLAGGPGSVFSTDMEAHNHL